MYYENSNKTVLGTFAQMEGDGNLRLDVTIKRNDALFVRNLKIIPLTENFPKLDQYKMTSVVRKEDYNKPLTVPYIKYKNMGPGHQVRIADFYADAFDLLPKYNRLTNIGAYHITYSTTFRSDDPIEMESFQVVVIAELMDNSGTVTTEKETLNFNRREHCWTSYAFH